MVHLQPEREHPLYSCRVLCCSCKQQFKYFPSPPAPNFMDSSYKIADLGEFWVTKSEALRDTHSVYTVKSLNLYTLLSLKSLFISPLKLGTCSVCCPWQLLQSAYVWQMAESLLRSDCQINCWWMFHTEQRWLLCLCSSALPVVPHKFFTALSPSTTFGMLSPTAESAGNVVQLQ